MPSVSTTGPAREAALDNLRAALVILVVVHHVAIAYSAVAPFYYVEPPYTDPVAFSVLGSFALLNQAWFMGALFFVSGLFAPGSVDWRGPIGFFSQRLMRLGPPILAAILLLEPLSRLGVFLIPEEITGIARGPRLSDYPSSLGLGPLWFALMLLIFDAGYAGWRGLRSSAEVTTGAVMPGLASIAAFALALALATYLFRFLVPMGQEICLGTCILNFPTISHAPQYLSFFVLGLIAARRGWLLALPTSYGVWGGTVAALAFIFLFPLALSARAFAFDFAAAGQMVGHGTAGSALYALWEALTAVGLLLAALAVFRTWFRSAGHIGRFLAAQSFAVYVIHVPILVGIAGGLRNFELPALVKAGLVSAIAIPVCFALAWALRQVAVIRRVL